MTGLVDYVSTRLSRVWVANHQYPMATSTGLVRMSSLVRRILATATLTCSTCATTGTICASCWRQCSGRTLKGCKEFVNLALQSR